MGVPQNAGILPIGIDLVTEPDWVAFEKAPTTSMT
jgi:hypothetical protein